MRSLSRCSISRGSALSVSAETQGRPELFSKFWHKKSTANGLRITACAAGRRSPTNGVFPRPGSYNRDRDRRVRVWRGSGARRSAGRTWRALACSPSSSDHFRSLISSRLVRGSPQLANASRKRKPTSDIRFVAYFSAYEAHTLTGRHLRPSRTPGDFARSDGTALFGPRLAIAALYPSNRRAPCKGTKT